MKKTNTLLPVLLACTLAGCAADEPETAADQPRATTPAAQGTAAGTAGRSPEADFLRGQLDVGEKELGLARVAAERATRADVKTFADTLAKHHQQANDELRRLGSQQQLTLTPSADQLRTETERLSKLSGPAFEREFLDEIIADHERAVNEVEQAANGTNAEIRQWAASTLPVMRRHLEQAKALRASAKGESPK